MAEVVREPAHAKINPYLRVLGKRDDGYHEIETLILPISLSDQVAVSPREEDGFALRVSGPLAARVPPGDDNLAVRAARSLAERTGHVGGANILVEKHVPVAAGLGGGSADAAAVLRALSRLWDLGFRVEELAEIGAEIGSDVPALVHRRPVIARGRGERIEPVDVRTTHWVLVTPSIEIRATSAYGWLRRWRGPFRRAPSLERLMSVLTAGNLDHAGALLHNDLAVGVRRRHREVREAEQDLLRGSGRRGAPMVAAGARMGVIGTVVSGSGPSVVGLCADAAEAGSISDALGARPVETIPSAEPGHGSTPS